jgi:hypothetical protein
MKKRLLHRSTQLNANALANYQMFSDEVFYNNRISSMPLLNQAPHPDDVKFISTTG